jgi:hypothetical protein
MASGHRSPETEARASLKRLERQLAGDADGGPALVVLPTKPPAAKPPRLLRWAIDVFAVIGAAAVVHWLLHHLGRLGHG